ncbi:MAG: GGDEF domain-containing protein [Candidatus Omnitrophota bacterium]|jgi:diguanylate cyclase (GGDEF)-like protein
MFYLAILILSSVVGARLIMEILRARLLKKSNRIEVLKFEHEQLIRDKSGLIEKNKKLGIEVNETIALYNLSKDICKFLDEDRIFVIFKERIRDQLNASDCQLLPREADLSLYAGFTVMPLIIQKDTIGYLAARGIADGDTERFQILAQQFLIGFKRALLYKKMQELSITDSLTQIFSRRHFLERFNDELRRSRKFKYNFSFLMIDIDRFKDFNDKYGHLVGDAILREISKTVKETIRQIDFVGRYGGEELSVILVETDKEQACFAGERLRRAVESKNIKVYDEELRVTVSVGIATFPSDGMSHEAIIEAADKAMYQAKEAGRNRVKYLS